MPARRNDIKPIKPKLKLAAPDGPEPLLVKPDQAARMLGIERNAIYKLMAGEIRTLRCGRSRLVPVSELRAWIARQLEDGAA